MTTELVYAQRIKKMTPRLAEIMNRLVLGQKGKEIQDEFGITPSRFSLIINSPLFQLELRKKLMRREEKILDIQDNLLEGAKLGSQLYKDILDSPDGYPTETKLKAANAATSLAVKLIHTANDGNGRGGGNGDSLEGKSYEERLREVTFKESVKTIISSPEEKEVDEIESFLGENYPPEEAGDLPSEADLLFGPVDKEEFEPLKKIEEILPKRDESESIVDSER